MFMLRVIAVGALVGWSALAASIIPGDARRGEQLFNSQQCVQCHSLKGKGGTLAPDLARRVDRDYTPDGDGQPDVESRAGYVGRDEEAGPHEGEHDSRNGRRPVRLLRVRPLLRKARRRRPRQAGLHRQPLRRLPRHHHVSRGGRAACRQVGVARRPRHPGPADVESRAQDARRIRQAEARLGQAHRAGTHRHAGLPAESAGDAQRVARTFVFPPSDSGEKLFESKGCTGCHVGKLALETCCSRIRRSPRSPSTCGTTSPA